MRILISADIEGISGVMSPDQTRPGSAAYERARLLMTREVNAAVEGALDGRATEVWVADEHPGNTTTSCWRNSTPALMSGVREAPAVRHARRAGSRPVGRAVP